MSPWCLDSNIFIYALNAHPEFAAASRAILERIEQDQPAVASCMVLTEVMRREKAIVLEAIEATRNLKFLAVDRVVSLEAARLLAHNGKKLKLVDAVHLATASHAGAEIFWTNDLQLKKVTVSGLSIKMLSDYHG